MTHSSFYLPFCAVLFVSVPLSTALAQDPTKVEPTHYKVAFENDTVQVVNVHYGPHEKSRLHSHPGGVVVVLTGLVKWDTLLDDAAPVVNTLKKLHVSNLRLVVLIGALMGMISSLLVFQIGQARVWFAMSRDGLFPKIFSRVHRSYLTPDFSTWVAGFVVGIPAGLLDIGTFADLSNIGKLFAFADALSGLLADRLLPSSPFLLACS